MAWAIKEMPDAGKVKERVRALKSGFNKVHYCFGNLKAYDYIELYK